MRKMALLAAVAALAVLPALGAAAQTTEGQVIVVHGVPDLEVDVYVNGDLTLEGFQFGEVAGPLDLPEGTYDVEIYAAGADPSADDPALSGSAELPAGAAATIAAYLQEGGDPTLGVFVEDNSQMAAGDARVTARHLADFGPVDVLADGSAVFSGVANGEGGDADVPAGTYGIQITAAGDPDTVAFDADVDLAEGTNTLAYAIGSVSGGSFQVATAALSGLGSAPDGVPTGTAGLAAATPMWTVVILAALAAVAMSGGAVALARSRR
ncbi:MAG: DUF4397 domain-containing protein [Actinomycetota bacterium]